MSQESNEPQMNDPQTSEPSNELISPRRQLDTRRSASMHPGRPSAATQPEGISPDFIWRVFCRWWKWTVPLGVLLAAGAGALVVMMHVNEYEAKALIMIEASEPYIAFNEDSRTRGSDRYVETQIELIRSPVVLEPVLARPEIAVLSEIAAHPDPVKHLQENLTIKQVGKSELYHIRFVSPSAENAANIANAIIAEYLSMHGSDDFRRAQRVIDVLEEERLRRQTEVEDLRRRVVELAQQVTGVDPFGHGAVTDFDRAFSPVATLYQNLTDLDVRREVLLAEVQALRDAVTLAADDARSTGLLDLEVANHADIKMLEAKINSVGEAMEVLAAQKPLRKGQKPEDHPDYIRLQQESAELAEELAQRKSELKSQLQSLRAEERIARQEELVAAKQHELKTLEASRKLYASRLDDHLKEMQSGGVQSVQLEFAKAELARAERVFELIAARKLALQTELRAPARIALQQKAEISAVPLEPVPFKKLIVACALALVSPMGLAVAREMAVKRISSAEQLATESLLPVIGEVARFPVRPVASRRLLLPDRQQREMFIFAESIDSLRTNLMLQEHVGAEGQQKIIAIASAVSGEGKTSVATSLAVSIAAATKKPTLIVDADLRSPDVAEVLGVPTEPGLAEVLLGQATLSEAVHRVGETNAYVLPAGKTNVNPHHVLAGAKVERLLDGLRAKFPTILVDTPPVFGASESLVYAKTADLVVICSLTDVSRAKQVRSAVDRMASTGANVVGAVLSGMPVRRYAYSYGYSNSMPSGDE